MPLVQMLPKINYIQTAGPAVLLLPPQPLDANKKHRYNILMNQTITISSKTIEEVLARLDKLAKEVKAIKTKLFEEEPPYGSDAWWEWSDKKALGEVRRGEGTKISNKKELDAFFKSL